MSVAPLRLAFLLALLPFGAQADTFCCEANGKTFCDDGIPLACHGKAYRQLNNRGIVIRQFAAPLTPEQKAQRDAELARQREEEAKRAEEDRRDRKLVGTYASLSELDFAHERVLTDMRKGQQQLEQKLADAEKRKKQLSNEAEFYQKRAMPLNLKGQIEDNERDIKAQQNAIATRKQDIETTQQKFEEEKQRYTRLTSGDLRNRP